MATDIHPTAVVDPAATLGNDVSIGPYCVVGPHAELCDRVSLMAHVVVDGHTRVGEATRIYPFASVGLPPQDLKYADEPSRLLIGRDNIIREHVTLHTGTRNGKMETRVGDGCMFMVGVHVAHDCRIGNRVIMANNATLGGHVEIGDHAIIGGLSAIHQFVRIGAHAMIGGMTGVEQDVIPFGLAVGERGHLAGLNITGLKRRGFDREEIHALRSTFKLLFETSGELAQRIELMTGRHLEYPAVRLLVDFVRQDSERRILKPQPEHAN